MIFTIFLHLFSTYKPFQSVSNFVNFIEPYGTVSVTVSSPVCIFAAIFVNRAALQISLPYQTRFPQA